MYKEEHDPRVSQALVSLANEGDTSTVATFLGNFRKAAASVGTNLIYRVLTEVSIESAAKLLMSDPIKPLKNKYDVLERDDAGELVTYLRTSTDVLDGDRLKVWLGMAIRMHIDPKGRFMHLAVHADYETLRAVHDEFADDEQYKKTSPTHNGELLMAALSVMTRIVKRRQAVIQLLAGEVSILPIVLAEIIGTYITADA